MKTAPGALVTLINSSNVFFAVDLYDIFLSNGDNLRLANSDRPIVYPATGTVLTPGTFEPFGFQRSGVHWSSTAQVDSLDVTMLVTTAEQYNGKPIAQAAREGIFDAARVALYRAFFTQAGVLVDALLHFEGTVGQVEPTSSSVRLVIKSELDKLSRKMPENLVQPPCAHLFLDDGCDPNPPGTLRASVTSTGTLAGTPTTLVVGYTGSAATNFYQLGSIHLTSGVCAGQYRAIRSDADSGGLHNLTLAVPLPAAPAAGDTYTLIRGCPRTQAACSAYGNLARFRGFPYVPRPEDAV